MPELPEVETIVQGLQAVVKGELIVAAQQSGLKMRAQMVPNFSKKIIHKTIVEIYRNAKYIVIRLNDDSHIIIHLGMSGRILIGEDIAPSKHDHLILHLASGIRIVFNDPRRFGTVCYSQEPIEKLDFFKNLGIEPLSNAFDSTWLSKATSRSSAPIKSFLMNANIIVGIGNIYACESLFAAGINPEKPAKQLKRKEIVKLVDAIKQVLASALASGGSTLRDYVKSNGDVGGFQHHFQVYGRKDQACFQCTTPIKMLRLSGRSTYYCPKCQAKR